jgi:membrane protease YdiL (CAAX protease family)
MSQPNAPHAGFSYSAAFFILMGLLLCGFTLGGGVSVVLWPILTGQRSSGITEGLLDPRFVNQVRVIQLVSTFFVFFLPAYITARILDRQPLSWLGYNRLADRKVIAMSLLLMALCIPVVGMLSEINEMIPVPASLEAVFREMEATYNRQVKAMTVFKGPADYIFTLLVMSLAPAIFEETFFRGGMQRILQGMTGRTWMPVIITSLIFSAVHFSYFGFIPRFALGMALGLLYRFSGSLWTSILAHFLNNAVVVTMMYYFTRQGMSPEEVMELEAPVWTGIPALAIVVYLFVKYRTLADRTRRERMTPEEKAWEEKWLA